MLYLGCWRRECWRREVTLE